MTDQQIDIATLDPVTAERISGAPLPTPKTLRRRRSLLFQSWRFALINLKMLRMVLKGH